MAGLRATIPIWIPAFAGKAGDYFFKCYYFALSPPMQAGIQNKPQRKNQ